MWARPSEEQITDTDVYSYLVWRASNGDLARHDPTAGVRAVYFTWQMMPHDLWQTALAVDEAIAVDRRDAIMSDRYGRCVAINLSALIRYYGMNNVHVYRAEHEDQTRPEVASRMQTSGDRRKVASNPSYLSDCSVCRGLI